MDIQTGGGRERGREAGREADLRARGRRLRRERAAEALAADDGRLHYGILLIITDGVSPMFAFALRPSVPVTDVV